ncbi:hypothetical protein [Lysinibacillus sphaericus]|nr:hypothetical protein [Lysinibacillus sphaericus]
MMKRLLKIGEKILNQKVVWENEEQFGCEYLSIIKEEKTFQRKGQLYM